MVQTGQSASIDIHPLLASLAAEIGGVELAHVDDGLFAAIHAAWMTYPVLVFRDQRLDDDTQIAFTRRFGRLEETVVRGVASNRHREIYEIANVDEAGVPISADHANHQVLNYNMHWHSDSSFKRYPAMASLLSARHVDPGAGATEFADMRAAYDSLPVDRKEALESLKVIHDIRVSQPRNWDSMTDADRAAHLPAIHTLVRTHPVSGRRSLFIGRHAVGIVGMDDRQAQLLLDALREHATQAALIYHHTWRDGDAVLWDNRCVLHRGRPYDMHRCRRILHRTTVAGEGPVV